MVQGHSATADGKAVWFVVVAGIVAVIAAVVAVRYRRARAQLELVAPDGGTCLRVRSWPKDPVALERKVMAALMDCGFGPVDQTWWQDRPGHRVRLSPPAFADQATLVEAPDDTAADVLQHLVERLIADGYAVRRTDERRVALRRGWRVVRVSVAPG